VKKKRTNLNWNEGDNEFIWGWNTNMRRPASAVAGK
jgi:hypothetical protein